MQSCDDDTLAAEASVSQHGSVRRMMRNVLLHYEGTGIDRVHYFRLRALGLFDETPDIQVPPLVAEVLADRDHPARLPGPLGPLIFVREGEGISVIEVCDLLLDQNREIRLAVLDHLRTANEPPAPWLTPHTLAVLEERAAACSSEHMTSWSNAGSEVVSVVRDDWFGHLSAFRQSRDHGHKEGMNSLIQKVMRPRAESMIHIRPPLWKPTDQKEEIETWITDLSQQRTLDVALSEYLSRSGYVPLGADVGAAELVRRWIGEHPCAEVTWEEVWAWAERAGTPLARYHALSIATQVSEARPRDSQGRFWAEVLNVVDQGTSPDGDQDRNATWWLYSALASHFQWHIEALWPGQDGEQTVCLGWYLASQVGRILGETPEQARDSLSRVVYPEMQLSFFRWSIARSPVKPSSLRHAALFMESVWGMSLARQLNSFLLPVPSSEPGDEFLGKIETIVKRHLLQSTRLHLLQPQVPTFAFEESLRTEPPLEKSKLDCSQRIDVLTDVTAFPEGTIGTRDFEALLEGLFQASGTEQHLTIALLREAVYSTNLLDDVISNWLSKTGSIENGLKDIPGPKLESLLLVLAEFQQRQRAEWPVRLPHLLTKVAEGSVDDGRTGLLHAAILMMSMNAGLVSPIQRLASSRARANFLDQLRIWRDNLDALRDSSEPWVVARIRATSAAISRLIGPRLDTTHR